MIALTWPSAWATASDSGIRRTLGHILSYPNKANDADEIGYTWVNWMVNHKLPVAIASANLPDSKRPKIVMLSHSFGVRLLSRALFSSKHLRAEYKSSNSVDLFIGLQGAVSGRRFVMNNGREGSPYAEFNSLPTRIILTTSKNDKANPFAHYVTGASHVGGVQGLQLALKHQKIFDVVEWVKGKKPFDSSKDKILMVDASSIVNDKTNVSGHNDVLDQEMAELIWSFIADIE